jgi:hypothetical protein
MYPSVSMLPADPRHDGGSFGSTVSQQELAPGRKRVDPMPTAMVKGRIVS